jgi:glycosyltransferase involved in cell wall biosynthesis
VVSDPLIGRDAFADYSQVESRTVVDQGSKILPVLTIAIPTFRREALLREALASALGQDWPEAIEVLVVDNDPDASGSAGQASIVDAGCRRLRYVVNTQNIGMFGNWNRCIELARGTWVTILNDDDLLDPSFARLMFDVLNGPNPPQALICRKRLLDERPSATVAGPTRTANFIRSAMFRGRRWRPVTARHLFWGNVIGNSVGLIARTQDMRALGGFDPNDFPASDYYLHTRLATHHRLGQMRDVLASNRVAENESMKPEVLYGFLRTGYRMQQTLAHGPLPRWWAGLSPALIARHVGELSSAWNVPLDRHAVERDLGIVLPPDRPRAMKMLRLALGGL